MKILRKINQQEKALFKLKAAFEEEAISEETFKSWDKEKQEQWIADHPNSKFKDIKESGEKPEGDILKDTPEKMHPMYRMVYENQPPKKNKETTEENKQEKDKKILDKTNEILKNLGVKPTSGKTSHAEGEEEYLEKNMDYAKKARKYYEGYGKFKAIDDIAKVSKKLYDDPEYLALQNAIYNIPSSKQRNPLHDKIRKMRDDFAKELGYENYNNLQDAYYKEDIKNKHEFQERNPLANNTALDDPDFMDAISNLSKEEQEKLAEKADDFLFEYRNYNDYQEDLLNRIGNAYNIEITDDDKLYHKIDTPKQLKKFIKDKTGKYTPDSEIIKQLLVGNKAYKR